MSDPSADFPDPFNANTLCFDGHSTVGMRPRQFLYRSHNCEHASTAIAASSVAPDFNMDTPAPCQRLARSYHSIPGINGASRKVCLTFLGNRSRARATFVPLPAKWCSPYPKSVSPMRWFGSFGAIN